MKETTYTIITAPTVVKYTCPYCEYEHEEDVGNFISNVEDEYEMWRGNANCIIECEDCEESFTFSGVDID